MDRSQKGREIRQELFGAAPGATSPLTEDIMALTNDNTKGHRYSFI